MDGWMDDNVQLVLDNETKAHEWMNEWETFPKQRGGLGQGGTTH